MSNSELNERISKLSKDQMAKVIEAFYESSHAITSLFTITATGSVYGGEGVIIDNVLGDLLHSENIMWNEIMDAEITALKATAAPAVD